MKIHLISLGCPKNLVDSEEILGGLQKEGVEIVAETQQADTIIVNTCGFIEDAKKESIETIFAALQLKKQGHCQKVLVTGCLSERYHSQLLREIPEVDGFWGAREIDKIPGEMAQALGIANGQMHRHSRLVTTAPVFAYLKIAEGCDNLCSFCAIPLIRGPHRSRSETEILAEAQRLSRQGIQELILVAQDTTYYGRDLSNGTSLARLLRQMESITGDTWLRLLYTYSDRIDSEFIEVIADSEQICHYLDIPLQHISDRILRRMKRGSRRVKIERLLEKLRARIPSLAIRTSLMVGFPGETEAEFQELFDFVEKAKFERLGVFQFSAEEGTAAADYPGQIPESVKQERFDILMQLQQELSLVCNRKLIGRRIEVLVEGKDSETGETVGRSRWDAPEIDQTVRLQGDIPPATRVWVTITSATEYDLFSQIEPQQVLSMNHN